MPRMISIIAPLGSQASSTRAIFPWQVYLSIFIGRVDDQQVFLDKFRLLKINNILATFSLTRKICQHFLIYTSNFSLSRQSCQGKIARVNGAILISFYCVTVQPQNKKLRVSPLVFPLSIINGNLIRSLISTAFLQASIGDTVERIVSFAE